MSEVYIAHSSLSATLLQLTLSSYHQPLTENPGQTITFLLINISLCLISFQSKRLLFELLHI